MKGQEKYRKLSGPSSFSNQRLYAGSDHLLAVDGQYEEEYRRFFYKDIQAFIIARTRQADISSGVLLCILAFASFMVLSEDQAFQIGGYIIGAPILILLVIHLLIGPTCDCRVKTAVQIERLRSLGSRRKARRVVGKLSQRIHEAQGELSQEDILRHVEAR